MASLGRNYATRRAEVSLKSDAEFLMAPNISGEKRQAVVWLLEGFRYSVLLGKPFPVQDGGQKLLPGGWI